MINDHQIQSVSTRISCVVNQLRAAGYRLTPQRLAVLRLLVTDERHPSIEEIFQAVRVDYPMVGLATIYNTVQRLKELGAVLELSFASGNRYDGVHPFPHAHLLCTRCGHIEDLPAASVLEALQHMVPSTGYTHATPRVEISGICPRCFVSQSSPDRRTTSVVH